MREGERENDNENDDTILQHTCSIIAEEGFKDLGSRVHSEVDYSLLLLKIYPDLFL